jgi:hypothetical protein
LSVVYSEPLPTFLSEFESPPVGDESESEEASSRTEVPADEPTPESPRRSDESSRPAGVSDVEDVRREIINAVADHLEAIIRSELTEAQWPDLIEELKRRLGL